MNTDKGPTKEFIDDILLSGWLLTKVEPKILIGMLVVSFLKESRSFHNSAKTLKENGMDAFIASSKDQLERLDKAMKDRETPQ